MMLVVARLPRGVCVMKAELLRNVFLGAGARLARYIRNDSAAAWCATPSQTCAKAASSCSSRRARAPSRPPIDPLQARHHADRPAGAGADPDRVHRDRLALPAQGLAAAGGCRRCRCVIRVRLGRRFDAAAPTTARCCSAARAATSPQELRPPTTQPHAASSRRTSSSSRATTPGRRVYDDGARGARRTGRRCGSSSTAAPTARAEGLRDDGRRRPGPARRGAAAQPRQGRGRAARRSRRRARPASRMR